jgi:hypothetical protein
MLPKQRDHSCLHTVASLMATHWYTLMPTLPVQLVGMDVAIGMDVAAAASTVVASCEFQISLYVQAHFLASEQLRRMTRESSRY